MATPARRKLSLVRLLILVLAVVGLGAAGWTQGSEAYRRITANPAVTWFAPYDDVTLTPTYHFEDLVVSPSLAQVLGFVVADPSTGCAPTWGTYYDLDGAGAHSTSTAASPACASAEGTWSSRSAAPPTPSLR